MPLPALAGAALAGSAMSTLANVGLNIANNKANRDAVNAQNRFTLSMWNRTNEYNKPSNVIARLRAAGINPNAALSGGDATTSAMPVSGASPIPFNPSSIPDVGSTILNAAQLSEAVKGQQVENQYKPAQIRASIENVVASTYESRMRAGKTIADTDKTRSDIRLNETTIKNLENQMSCLSEQTSANVKQIYAQCSLIAEQVLLAKKQGKSLDYSNIVDGLCADLASKYGIVTTKDGLTALISGLVSPKSGDLLRDAIKNLISSGPSAIIEGAVGGVKQGVSKLRSLYRKLGFKK